MVKGNEFLSHSGNKEKGQDSKGILEGTPRYVMTESNLIPKFLKLVDMRSIVFIDRRGPSLKVTSPSIGIQQFAECS